MLLRLLHQTKSRPVGRFMSRLRQAASNEADATAERLLRKTEKDETDIEQSIIEEDLYRYNRYRWLCNEPEKLDVRYRKFNLNNLLDAAVRSARNGAKSCVKVLKCVESQYNKILVLTMDNGAKLVVKILNSNADPAFYITASEIATRHFLRDIFDILIPRVYASSFDTNNTVGAEYIFEEKSDGQPLGNF